MKSQHILIFNWRDPWDPRAGGAERVTLMHALAWVKKGHTVSWVSGQYSGAKQSELKDGITYYRRGSSQTLFLRAWWIYFQEFNSLVDIIIDEVHGLPMFTPLWKRGVKVVVLIHEVAKEIWDEMFPPPINWIGRFIEHRVFPYVYKREQFWVDGPSTQLDLIDLGIPKNQIAVIPCAITPPILKKSYPKETVLTCVFVARLVKMKGIEYALETFKKVLNQAPNAKLWIVGSGQPEYLKHLVDITQTLGIEEAVVFHGRVTESIKYQLLARSHFLLHTSVREGFGLTVLEANSQSTPAAVFDVPALRDLVDNSRGVIVPFPDTEQLADHIVKVYKDPKQLKALQRSALAYSTLFQWSSFTPLSEKVLGL